MRSFKLDTQSDKLFILVRVGIKEKFDEKDFRYYRIRVLNLSNRELIVDIPLKNMALTSCIASGYCSIQDGHIYFGNNVIKTRYDLIKRFD